MSDGGPNKSTEAIRDMIDHRLKSLSEAEPLTLPSGSHLDEDTISAFVEGRLGTTESKPVLSHLTACGPCRRASAQLVRLENQIDAESPSAAVEEEPGRLRAFLSNLPSLVPSAEEEVVFAYQNPEAEEKEREKVESVPESGDDEQRDKTV